MKNTWKLGSVGVCLAVVTVAACGGSDTSPAATCGPLYQLGCIGDGRPQTPDSPRTTSCGKDDYSYFKVHVTSASPRSEISRCELVVAKVDGTDGTYQILADFQLLSGTSASGTSYGCIPGETHADVGMLSYSRCGAAGETLQFAVQAFSADETLLQEGHGEGVCEPGGLDKVPEKSVEIAMTIY
jgi:hypothetical protein